MALAVVIRMLDQDGDDYPRGALSLRPDGGIEEWPPGDVVLEGIVGAPIFVPEELTARDAAAFLQGLCRQYRSPYLYADRAADLSDDDLAAIEYEASLTPHAEAFARFGVRPKQIEDNRRDMQYNPTTPFGDRPAQQPTVIGADGAFAISSDTMTASDTTDSTRRHPTPDPARFSGPDSPKTRAAATEPWPSVALRPPAPGSAPAYAVDPEFEAEHPRAPEGTAAGGEWIEKPDAAAPAVPADQQLTPELLDQFIERSATGPRMFKARVREALALHAAGLQRGWLTGLHIEPLPSDVRDCTGDYVAGRLRTRMGRGEGTLLHELGHHIQLSQDVQRPAWFLPRLRELFAERRNEVIDALAQSGSLDAKKALNTLERSGKNVGVTDIKKSSLGFGNAYTHLRGVTKLPAVTPYAMSNYKEYWAESFEYYFTRASYLKAKDPKMYAFIAEVQHASAH